MVDNGKRRGASAKDDALREIPNLEVITVRPPSAGDGDAYSAETVVRAVPTELLREFHASLKPQKLPSFETEDDDEPASPEGALPATPKSAPPAQVASEPPPAQTPEALTPADAVPLQTEPKLASNPPPSTPISAALATAAEDLEIGPTPETTMGDRSVTIALALTLVVVLALCAALYWTS